ncbi:MAG TPA: hypothetical protein PLS51_14035 [Flavobacterium sp.]|nr:hypothetical protein [Flavobacterium sp.]HPJ11748.1 hypothetical protein [Flavobacterium sp.]
MKLLLITAIKAFEPDIKDLLESAAVTKYSYRDVTGYNGDAQESIIGNWFAQENNETDSVLFYAIVNKEIAQEVLALSDAFNDKQASPSQVHVAILHIEASNHPHLNIVR